MQPKKRVLIVDNNERALCAVQEALEDAGFDTRTTWSGYEALEWLQSNAFDVLVVDDYLPDLHAGDFLNRVACLAMQPRIIVMQACAPTAHSVRHYAALGASAVVRKHDAAAICKGVESCGAHEPLMKTRVN